MTRKEFLKMLRNTKPKVTGGFTWDGYIMNGYRNILETGEQSLDKRWERFLSPILDELQIHTLPGYQVSMGDPADPDEAARWDEWRDEMLTLLEEEAGHNLCMTSLTA